MKKIFLFCVTAAALTLLAASCQKEEPFVTPDEMVSQTLKVYPVSLSITEDDFADAEGETKSQISSSSEAIQRAMLFAMGSDGKVLLRENASGQAVPITKMVSSSAQAASFTWDLPVASFTIYAIANYDDATANTLNSYASNVNLTTTMLNNLTYTNNSTTFLTTIPAKGMPAAGTKAVTISTPGSSIGSVNLKKLFARYDIKFNTDYFTDKGYTVTATAIQSISSPSTTFWFQANQKPGSGASYNALDSATSSDLNNVSSSGCTLYVLENCQGTKSGFAHWYDVQFATSSTLAGLTNILINTTYTDGNNLERKAVCRVYLGSDCRTDFNVRRGVKTNLNLDLREGVGREIYLGDGNIITSGPAVVHTVPFYTTLQSKDDLIFSGDNWFTLGDVTFGPNTSSVHPECGYAGTVTYTVNSNARANSDKKIYVNGKNRNKSDSVVWTDIYDEAKVHFPYSFTYAWTSDAVPNHVAQRGILTCIDRYTGSTSEVGIFTANDSGITLGDFAAGSKTVTLRGAFTQKNNAIHIEAPNGEGAVDVPLEARVPWFGTSAISPAVNFVDAASRVRFTYYAASASGEKTSTAMKVVNNGSDLTAITAGENLDLALVNELIAPVLGAGGSSLLGYNRYLENDGNFNISVFINTYEGLPARMDATLSSDKHKFNVGKTSIGMKSIAGGHGQAADEQDFEAYNPWRLITTVTQGGVMNDYTLYNEPARNGMQMAVGWATDPADAPTESGAWTTDIGNVIIARDEHLSYNASFQDGAGYLGSKVCSHVGSGPSAVDPTFVPSSSSYYQLTIRITDTSNYDWETLGNYLWYDQGHYLPGSAWADPSATPAQRKAAVDDVFSGGPIYITPWVGQSNEAWNYTSLPTGVSQTTPSAINGVLFEVRQRTETINSVWTLRYSMEGLKEADISTHNAGKIDVVLRIINPFNEDSPSLDKKVSEAYVRLHMYVWPAPYAVESVHPAWHDNITHGWGYDVFPYCFTGGKRVYGLDGRDFFSKGILIPATETYTSTSTAFLKSHSASVGTISRTIGSGSYMGSAIFQFYNNDAFSDSDTEAEKMAKLLGYMSDNQTSDPFKLRNPGDQTRSELRYSEGSPGNWTDHFEDVTYDGLDDVLGSATYYKEDDYTLYYDPTGNENIYTYTEGGQAASTGKLFVVHIGGNNLSLRYGHYFDPYWF